MHKLYGHLASPYSIKMRALLRYRQIPFQFKSRYKDWEYAFPKVKVPVMPVLEYPDGSFKNDSTNLIFDIERAHQQRSVIPVNEEDAFLAFLIEDMADEWLSKNMYAYRWTHPEFTQWTGRLIAYDHLFGEETGLQKLESHGAAFEQRQVGRNTLVGCTQANMPLINHIGERALDIMESHVVEQPFLFGSRPSIAEFGLYGQMSQYIIDLSAIEPCQTRAPYTMRWLHHMDDLSGSEGEWSGEWPNGDHSSAVEALLLMIGEEYFPFLLANADAVASETDSFSISVCGYDYQQAPFKYQLKCLQQLRQAYAGLSDKARANLEPLLKKTNCLAPLAMRLKKETMS